MLVNLIKVKIIITITVEVLPNIVIARKKLSNFFDLKLIIKLYIVLSNILILFVFIKIKIIMKNNIAIKEIM